MAKFDYFVVFAEMRTGSNLLEANINRLDNVMSHGEAFNPSFIGYPQYDNVLGVTQAMREADPAKLITAIAGADGLNGFRFFNDHDQRALNICLPDPRCAKIILTRNPIDSYVSWKIAKATGQWKLTNATHAKTQKIHFDRDEFTAHLSAAQAFQLRLVKSFQTSGQTAFYLNYDDLNDLDVMNGLAAFLGTPSRLDGLDRKLKKQNPSPAIDKVENPDEMIVALAERDQFNLNQTPSFEPRRGPMVPAFFAAPDSKLLYLPLRSSLDQDIGDWLATLDGKKRGDLHTQFTQKTLRQWKRDHPGNRSFAVLRHPVTRAHTAFCNHILFEGPRLFPKIRDTLRRVHKLPIPKDPVPQRNIQGYDIDAHRSAFLAFCAFLKQNLSAQTAIRVDPAWATQSAVLQGMAQVCMPDFIFREQQLANDLRYLADQIGQAESAAFQQSDDAETVLLQEIYNPQIERAVQDAYARDYNAFGFESWG